MAGASLRRVTASLAVIGCLLPLGSHAQDSFLNRSISDQVAEIISAEQARPDTVESIGLRNLDMAFLQRHNEKLTWYHRQGVADLVRDNRRILMHRDLLLAFAELRGRAEDDAALLQLLNEASDSQDWQRAFIASFLLTRFHAGFHADSEKGQHFARKSLQAISPEDLSPDAYWARYAAWTNLSTIYTTEFDLPQLLPAVANSIKYAEGAGTQMSPSWIYYNPTFLLANSGYHDEAARMSEAFFEASENEEDLAFAHQVWGRALIEMNNLDGAIENFRKAKRYNSNPSVESVINEHLATALARSGRATEALALVKSAGERNSGPRSQSRALTYVDAKAAGEAGDYETAYRLLDRWSELQTSYLRDRVAKAAQSSKLALAIDAEVLDARTAEELAEIEVAREREALARAEAARAEARSRLTTVIAALATMLGIFAMLLLFRERRWSRERKQKDDEIAELTVKSQAAKIAKQQFVSIVSHEMRTPLNHIIPMVQQLVEHAKGSDPKTVTLSKIIDKGAARILRMTDEITLLTGGADSMTAHLEEFPVTDILSSIEEEQELDHVLNGSLDLRLDMSDMVPSYIVADRPKLTRALMALLENAQKFGQGLPVILCFDYDHTPRHSTDTGDEMGDLIIRVIDQGGGIPEDRIQTLLEPFTQADMSLSRPGEGFGIGFSLVAILCRVIGADFSLENSSREGREDGVCATLRVPAIATDGSMTWEPSPESDLRREAREFLENSPERLKAAGLSEGLAA